MKRVARWQDVSRNSHRSDYCLRFCASVTSWRYPSTFIVSPAAICCSGPGSAFDQQIFSTPFQPVIRNKVPHGSKPDGTAIEEHMAAIDSEPGRLKARFRHHRFDYAA